MPFFCDKYKQQGMVARRLAAPRFFRAFTGGLEKISGPLLFFKETKEDAKRPLSFFYREIREDKTRRKLT